MSPPYLEVISPTVFDFLYLYYPISRQLTKLDQIFPDLSAPSSREGLCISHPSLRELIRYYILLLIHFS